MDVMQNRSEGCRKLAKTMTSGGLDTLKAKPLHTE